MSNVFRECMQEFELFNNIESNGKKVTFYLRKMPDEGRNNSTVMSFVLKFLFFVDVARICIK